MNIEKESRLNLLPRRRRLSNSLKENLKVLIENKNVILSINNVYLIFNKRIKENFRVNLANLIKERIELEFIINYIYKFKIF